MLNWVFVLLCSWQKRWDHLTFFSHSKIELWWSQKGMTCHHKLALGACLSSTQFSFNVLYVEIFKKSSSPCFVHSTYIFSFLNQIRCSLNSSAHHMFSRKTNFQDISFTSLVCSFIFSYKTKWSVEIRSRESLWLADHNSGLLLIFVVLNFSFL